MNPVYRNVWAKVSIATVGLLMGALVLMATAMTLGPSIWARGRRLGEDVAWVDACCEKARGEIRIVGEPLYFYKFSESGSTTR